MSANGRLRASPRSATFPAAAGEPRKGVKVQRPQFSRERCGRDARAPVMVRVSGSAPFEGSASLRLVTVWWTCYHSARMNIQIFLPTAVALAWLALPLVASAQDAKPKADAKKAKAAPSPVTAPITDEPGLPRVLLIGDSISMGYTLPVRELLKGKANLHRIPANGGPTVNGLKNLKAWLGTGKWDVIHFNFGIHDAKFMQPGQQQVPPADYERNLRDIVKQLQATGAKLIWATITPIPDGELNPPRAFDKVPTYNAIARKVMEENSVSINDLNADITPHLARLQNPKDVHFNREGSEFLGKQVAAKIGAQLPKK